MDILKNLSTDEPLSIHTTTRVGGNARFYFEPASSREFVEAIKSADDMEIPVVMIGQGANIVFADEQFVGIVICNRANDITIIKEDDDFAYIKAESGVSLSELCDYCTDKGLRGLETLFGIPGNVGGTTVQNVGAYGNEISEFIYEVDVYDRKEKKEKTFSKSDIEFDYRYSSFKDSFYRTADCADDDDANNKAYNMRYAIISVTYKFEKDAYSVTQNSQIANKLGVNLGDKAKISDIKNAVFSVREAKGMVAYENDFDFQNAVEIDYNRCSTGSFFKNPFVEKSVADKLPENAPKFEGTGKHEGTVKIPAAWLIENAGLNKGFGLNDRATLSTKHVLAITNRGNATAKDITELAKYVQKKVYERFGIKLVPEAIMIGDKTENELVWE